MCDIPEHPHHHGLAAAKSTMLPRIAPHDERPAALRACSALPAISPPFDAADPFLNAVPAVLPSRAVLPTELPTPSPDYHHLAAHDLTATHSFFPPVATLSTPPLSKLARGQHLPPFRLAGISVPHPDHVLSPTDNPFSAIGCGPLSKPEDPLHDLSPAMSRVCLLGGVTDAPAGTPEAPALSRGHVPTYIPTITPPADTKPFLCERSSHVKTATSGSGPETGANLTSRPAGPPALPQEAVTASNAPAFASSSEEKLWVQAARAELLANVGSLHSSSIRVLSHALPCPSRAGHAFPIIVDAIHRYTPTVPTTWINVFHAVPGRFILDDIPTSPPSTPGPTIGGEDYFTTKVFDSAVSVSDYQGHSNFVPPSPRPVVPPGSVDFSIVERYIPPTNVNEFAELFLFTGRSILLDRLAELSSTGSLLFIYPTRTGAKTFMNEYLGPVLDPILRAMTVVNDLSAGLGLNLGNMESVDHLVEYSLLEARIKRFCQTLTNDATKLERYHSKNAAFSVVHASKQEVPLAREVWSRDWWVKQEKGRVRAAVSKYFRIAHKLPSDSETMPTNLIQEILDGVATKPYELGEPQRGVEVGVFVIRKSS